MPIEKISPVLGQMRFCGYVGVSANALVVPVAVWEGTHSAFWTGLGLFLEWLPKLWAYMSAGKLCAKHGAARAQKAAEIIRVLALALLAYAAFSGNWQLALLCAPAMQVCNAVVNVCFESLAHKSGIKAHARLMQCDLAAGLALVPLAQVLQLWEIAAAGCLLAGASAALSAKAQGLGLYGDLEQQSGLGAWSALRAAAARPGLRNLALAGLFIGTPVAAAYSFLPAILGHAGPGWGKADFISAFGAARALATITALPALSRVASPGRLLAPSIGAIAASFACLWVWQQGWGVLAALGCAGLAHSSYNVWTRQTRQTLLEPGERLSLSGALISMEACAYLAGAGLIACLPSEWVLNGICALSLPLCAAGLALAADCDRKAKNKAALAKAKQSE